MLILSGNAINPRFKKEEGFEVWGIDVEERERISSSEEKLKMVSIGNISSYRIGMSSRHYKLFFRLAAITPFF